MRTTSAASPRRLHWQAAFTTKPYKAQTSSLVVWQHVFVSDTPMTNWCGSSLLLTRVVKKNPSAQNVVRALTVNAAHQQNVSPPRSLGGSRDSTQSKILKTSRPITSRAVPKDK
jgi:hypothetical protein